MSWAGPVTCPNCELPIDSDVSICPYCYSTAPRDAPWQGRAVSNSWWSWALVFIALAVFVTVAVSDACFGTQWMPQLLEFFRDKGG
jgi:hypothetical protein